MINMNPVRLQLILLLLFFTYSTARIQFTKCGTNGFTCTNVTDRKEVVFDCTSTDLEKETHFWVWELNMSSINSLHLKNCKSLHVDFQCKRDSNFVIHTLIIENVTDLSFFNMEPYRYPENVILQDIYIKKVPKGVFTYSGCSSTKSELNTLTLRKAKIGTIKSDAINLSNIWSFVMENSTIETVESRGLKLDAKKNSKKITFQSNRINNLNGGAVDINGKEAHIFGNIFCNVNSNALRGNVTKFHFYNNTVNVTSRDGFAVISENIQFYNNHFKVMKSGAFGQFRSPSLKDPNKPKFNFSYNFVDSAEANSLYPDLSTYANVTNSIIFANNTLPCTCKDVSWLGYFDGITRLYWKLKQFYEMLVHRRNRNICAFLPCTVPINFFRRVALDGNCTEFLTEENICQYLVANFL